MNKYKWFDLIALVLVAFSFLGTLFTAIVFWFPNLLSFYQGDPMPDRALAIFTAWLCFSTLFLALAAFKTLGYSEANRKTELIVTWATEMGTLMLEDNTPPFKDITKDKARYIWDVLNEPLHPATHTPFEIVKFRMQSVYIISLSKSVPKLTANVNDTVKKLKWLMTVLYENDRNKGEIHTTEEQSKASMAIATAQDELYDEIIKLLDIAGGI